MDLKVGIEKIKEIDLNLNNVRVIHQRFTKIQSYNFMNIGRPNDGLCVYTSGTAHYRIEDAESGSYKEMTATVGDLVYLPKGGRYIVRFNESDEEVTDYLMNFSVSDADGRPIVFSDRCEVLASGMPEYFTELFKEASELFLNRVNNTQNILKSYAFKILDCASLIMFKNEPVRYDKKLVTAAMAYIRNHASERLSVKEVAAVSNISERHLRTLFERYAGISPIGYKTEVLVEKAKEMLKNNVMNINETAEYLGYYDAAHFSKVFKRTVGVSPTSYIKGFEGKTPYGGHKDLSYKSR